MVLLAKSKGPPVQIDSFLWKTKIIIKKLKYITNNIYYNCTYKYKLFKINIDKILFKIDSVTRKLVKLAILTIEKEILVWFEYEDLISNFVC